MKQSAFSSTTVTRHVCRTTELSWAALSNLAMHLSRSLALRA